MFAFGVFSFVFSDIPLDIFSAPPAAATVNVESRKNRPVNQAAIMFKDGALGTTRV